MIFFWVFLILVSSAVSVAMAEEPKIVDAFVGIPIDLKLPEHREVKLGQAQFKCARVQLSANGKTLRITPRGICSQTVSVQEVETGKIVAQYILNINDSSLSVIRMQVQTALAEVDGVKVSIAGGRVLIDGQVMTSQEIGRIHSVAKMYGDRVRSLVTVSPAQGDSLAKIIERKIGNPEIRVQVINGHILLEGVANTPAEAQRAQLIAEMYTPNIVVDEAVADRKVLKVHPN